MANNLNFKSPLIIVGLLTIGMLIGKYSATKQQYVYLSNNNTFPTLIELLNYISYNYVDDIDLDSLQEEVITYTLESLDPHSSYIPAKELQEITETMTGNFDGIGVEFQILDDTIIVVSPISGGPSQEKGIRAGDRIVKVDTLNVAGVGFTNKDVVRTLRGPKGTSVNLYIKRKGIQQLLPFEIIRDKIPLTSVDVAYMIDDKNAYIKVNRFSGTTEQEFSTALKRLKNKDFQALILDLRSNPGGFLSAAIAMLDEFLPAGKLLVYTEGNAREKQVYVSTRAGSFHKGDIVVLVDEGSASASEIVAGAIQDQDRGYVVGRRTFGKGLVQEQSMLTSGGAFRLTTSRYYTPSGRSIQKPYSNDINAYHSEAIDRYHSGELYDEDSLKVTDSLKFYTKSGRIVYGGGGISPDYFIALDSLSNSQWLYDIVAQNLVNTFVFDYVENNLAKLTRYSSAEQFCEGFHITEIILDDFVSYTKTKGLSPTPKQIDRSKDWLQLRLKARIAKHQWNDEGLYRVINEQDDMVIKALDILQNGM